MMFDLASILQMFTQGQQGIDALASNLAMKGDMNTEALLGGGGFQLPPQGIVPGGTSVGAGPVPIPPALAQMGGGPQTAAEAAGATALPSIMPTEQAPSVLDILNSPGLESLSQLSQEGQPQQQPQPPTPRSAGAVGTRIQSSGGPVVPGPDPNRANALLSLMALQGR